MGSGTHSSDFDGFLGTHGTHANGAAEPKLCFFTIIALQKTLKEGAIGL